MGNFLLNILCKLFGHKIRIKTGDCWIANSEKHCIVKALFKVCTRKDYWEMIPHKHVIKNNRGIINC